MRFNFKNQDYRVEYWSVEMGRIGHFIAFDTETEIIDKAKVPRFILGQAYAGNNIVYLIKDCTLLDFFNIHQDCTFMMQNAPFDIAVVEKEVQFDFDLMIRQERLFDTGILYRLYELATKGEVPHKWSLQELSKIYLGIDLNKNEAIRCSFDQFIIHDDIDYAKISQIHLNYAAIDAIVTYEIFKILNKNIESLNAQHYLSHKIQLMGAVALYKVSLNGISLDLNKKLILQEDLQKKIDEDIRLLSEHGYVPGKKGVIKDFEIIVHNLGLDLPRTPKGSVSRKSEDLEKYSGKYPFIDAYISYQNKTKMMSFVNNLKEERIHTNFISLLNTGRTSSSSPNLQNIPRNIGLRECFVPSPGNYFIIIDYSQLELCTLAQTCYDKYGFSKMKDLINDGIDLHRWFASIITAKPENQVTDLERKQAKACNFGFPGGLGIDNFLKFAKSTYGIEDITEEKAKELKTKWVETFPEMKLYLKDHLLEKHNFTSLKFMHFSGEFEYEDESMACSIFKRIISGEQFSKKDKTPYPESTIKWAFEKVLPEVAPHVPKTDKGSPELLKEILKESVELKTGRIRSNCSYTEARNTPFQGLAADGAKIAIYRLIKNDYRVVNFIHDEFIIEIPQSSNNSEEGEKIKDIIVKAMTIVVPDVRINAEWKVSDCWGDPSACINNNSSSRPNRALRVSSLVEENQTPTRPIRTITAKSPFPQRSIKSKK